MASSHAMDLRAFVRQVLDDVHAGLTDHLRQQANELIAGGHLDSATAAGVLTWERDVRTGDVVFDVAVTVSEQSSSSGSASLKVIGGTVSTTDERETVQRVQFTIRGLPPTQTPLRNKAAQRPTSLR